MLFRDLIQEEEFIVGEMVYSTLHRNYILLESWGNSQYVLMCDGSWYTENGLYYGIADPTYDTAEDWCKDIITNNMDRIFPTKYKPI